MAEKTEAPVDAPAGQSNVAGDQRMAIARNLYQSHCADCHGDDGSATEMRDDFPGIPDFHLLSWQSSRSVGNLRASIKLGMGDEMPAFDGQISDDEIKFLAELVRTFSPEFKAKVAESKNAASPSASSKAFARELQKLESQWQRQCEEFKAARAAMR